MIRILNYIGQQLRENGDPVELLFLVSKEEFDIEKNKTKKDIVHTLNILIDLDTKEFTLERKEASFDDVKKFRCIPTGILPRQTDKRAIPCTFANKNKLFFQSVFDGEFINAIDSLGIRKDTLFYKILEAIRDVENKKEIQKYIIDSLNKDDLFITLSVKSKLLDSDEYVPLSEIEGFDELFSLDNLWNLLINAKAYKGKNISYVDNQEVERYFIPAFVGRMNINTIFVTTTKNFASYFKDEGFNYIVSLENLQNLNIASKFILNNWRTRIAGIPHFFIPTVLDRSLQDNIDIVYNVKKMQQDIELLFDYNKIISSVEDVDYEQFEENPIWITFYGYETDGNSFKILNIINDISAFRLKTIKQLLGEIQTELSEITGRQQNINFYSFYRQIPIKYSKGKIADKIPISLKIFKDILEGHKIDALLLYQLAAKTFHIQHYKNENYNIYVKNEFDFLIRDTILTYFALFKLIKKLKLMEGNTQQTNENKKALYQEKEDAFFEKMGYNDAQKAMFYLGRLLSLIASAQFKKGHETKPILNKLNYNGMDKREIMRLAEDLFEKIRQYAKDLSISTAEYFYAMFNKYFNPNNWTLSPQEALFYLLSGYSYILLTNKQQDNGEN